MLACHAGGPGSIPGRRILFQILKKSVTPFINNRIFFTITIRSHWRKCCFSGDGEFVCAGSMKQHSIYIWERASGTLVKILHGQKGETLLDVIWHPLRPIVISISNSVTKEQVSIWAQTQVVGYSDSYSLTLQNCTCGLMCAPSRLAKLVSLCSGFQGTGRECGIRGT